jgi:cytochrome c oxidase subunit III
VSTHAISAPARSRPTGWWGVVLLIVTEATLFALLVAVYFYLRFSTAGAWPPGRSAPSILEPLLATLVLASSSLPLAIAASAAKQGRPRGLRMALVSALALGIAFLAFEWVLIDDSLGRLRPSDDAYGSIFYTLLGAHYAHTVAAVLAGLWTLLRVRLMTSERHLTLQVTALYWHFVNAVAVVVFLCLYLSPRA